MIQVLLGVVAASVLPTHNVHVSLAEAEWTGQSLEVTLDVRTEDLERALKGPITERNVARLLAKYVVLHYDPTKQPAPQSFLGFERHGASTTLFFEFTVRGRPKDYALEHTLFFELERQQRHTVIVTHGKARRTLLFNRKHRQRALWPHASKAMSPKAH